MSVDTVAMPTLTQAVAEEIRVVMARRQMRQSQLARKLGENDQWLSIRLRGVKPINLDELQRIAIALEVPVADLMPDLSRPLAPVRAQPTSQYASRPQRRRSDNRRPPDRRPVNLPSVARRPRLLMDPD